MMTVFAMLVPPLYYLLRGNWLGFAVTMRMLASTLYFGISILLISLIAALGIRASWLTVWSVQKRAKVIRQP